MNIGIGEPAGNHLRVEWNSISNWKRKDIQRMVEGRVGRNITGGGLQTCDVPVIQLELSGESPISRKGESKWAGPTLNKC